MNKDLLAQRSVENEMYFEEYGKITSAVYKEFEKLAEISSFCGKRFLRKERKLLGKVRRKRHNLTFKTQKTIVGDIVNFIKKPFIRLKAALVSLGNKSRKKQ